MKILIKPNQEYAEIIDAMLGLQNIGHQVVILDSPLHLKCAQEKPNLIIVAEPDLNLEIKQVVGKYNAKLLVINRENQLTLFGQNSKKSLQLPRFANIFKYRNTLSDESLLSDIYIHCADSESAIFAQGLCQENKKIKVSCVGPMHCTNFVGIVNVDEIVKLAKSSKLTLSNNNILIDSLIFAGIPAIHIKDYFGITDAFNLDNYVLSEQKQIQPINNILSLINENISNTD